MALHVNTRFDEADDVLTFGGSATISVAGEFELSGEINATDNGNGTVLIDVPEMSLALNINDMEVFDVGGAARFSIGGTDGFQLIDIGLTTVEVFGIDVSAIAGSAVVRAAESERC